MPCGEVGVALSSNTLYERQFSFFLASFGLVPCVLDGVMFLLEDNASKQKFFFTYILFTSLIIGLATATELRTICEQGSRRLLWVDVAVTWGGT